MSTRISTSQIFYRTQNDLANAKERESISAEKATSLKALNRPSDSPAEWVIAGNLKDDVAVRDGMAKNAALAGHILTATENVIAQAQDIVQKMHELALSASGNDILGKTSPHVLPEAEGLYNSFIQNLNTKFGNRTLLGGFKSDRNVFDAQGNYYGDDGKVEFEVDRGLKVPININAKEAVFGEGLQNGVNIIGAMQRLVSGLALDDKTVIRSSLDELGAATDQLSVFRTKIAGSMSEIERSINIHNSNNIQSKDTVSRLEEADPVKVFSDLARDQTVLRAAIDTTHKLLTGSPADVLLK